MRTPTSLRIHTEPKHTPSTRVSTPHREAVHTPGTQDGVSHQAAALSHHEDAVLNLVTP
ncbi:unnamed protein product, partial [Tilletia caries]